MRYWRLDFKQIVCQLVQDACLQEASIDHGRIDCATRPHSLDKVSDGQNKFQFYLGNWCRESCKSLKRSCRAQTS
jgi:hypothetical protein